MANNTADATVGDLVTERPARARVFEQSGVDYCCNGADALSEACLKAGADLQSVLDQLAAVDAAPRGADEADWASASLAQLMAHIEATHHTYLKSELPRISALATKTAAAHGAEHPNVVEAAELFQALRAELEGHLHKEEVILFPMIRLLEVSAELPQLHCGSVKNPIAVMEHEHDNAGAVLARLRELTDGYSTPDGVCNTYRALMDALAQLEQDLHLHIHKENSILHPRAAAREAQLASA